MEEHVRLLHYYRGWKLADQKRALCILQHYRHGRPPASRGLAKLVSKSTRAASTSLGEMVSATASAASASAEQNTKGAPARTRSPPR